MLNYEYEFVTALRSKLKEKLLGKIFCKVINNELYVEINNFGLEFKMHIDDFANKVLNGYSTDYAMYEIITTYKKFVLHKYFI